MAVENETWISKLYSYRRIIIIGIVAITVVLLGILALKTESENGE